MKREGERGRRRRGKKKDLTIVKMKEFFFERKKINQNSTF
jgi:hypothetical protein